MPRPVPGPARLLWIVALAASPMLNALACGRSSADAAADARLARDLAAVQFGGTAAASRSPGPASDSMSPAAPLADTTHAAAGTLAAIPAATGTSTASAAAPPAETPAAAPARAAPAPARRTARARSRSASRADTSLFGPCGSPAAAAQKACLAAYIEVNDARLNRVYRTLIATLRRRAGARSEPESVRRLRTAQRAWIGYRDRECRRRTRGSEGPLWAPIRARCLGELSDARAAELAATLAHARAD